MKPALSNLTPDQQSVVRTNVFNLLSRSSAFEQLGPEEARKVANSLVNVVAYLSDPKAGQTGTTADPPRGEDETEEADRPVLAQAQASGQRIVQDDFTAAAGREGAELFERLTGAVDFPEFVAGLIDGVFNSIVDASIRQMDAYSKLLEAVVKSVNGFAQENFTPNQGRDYIADRFPNLMQVNFDRDEPRLELTAEGEDGGLEQVQAGLGMEEEIDLDDDEGELALAERGKLEMARLRQKQLATMVLLGINRIVVTDGLINAKVIIDVRTRDVAERVNTASSYDSKASQYRRRTSSWFGSDRSVASAQTKTVVSSAMEDTSESKAETKAKLSGEVRVNFRSETFPLERVASQTQLETVNQVAQPSG